MGRSNQELAVSRLLVVVIVVAIIVLAALGALYASTLSKPPSKNVVITIGADVPMTGTFSVYGPQDVWAYSYAINQTNQEGGVYLSSCKCNATLKLVYYDDASDPTTAQSNVQRLTSVDNATAILGGFATPIILAEARVAQAQNTPFLGIGSADDPYDSGNYTYVFIPFMNLNGQFTPILNYFQTLPHSQRPTKAAFWIEDSPLGHDSFAAFQTLAQQYGIQVVYSATYEPGTTDFSSIILATKASGATFLAAIPTPPDGITMLSQMRNLNYTPSYFLMQRAPEFGAFPCAAGANANGVIDDNVWNMLLNTPGNQQLVQAWNSTHPGDIPFVIGEAYTCALLLIHAIQTSSSANKNSIREALSTTNMSTPMGQIWFPLGYGHAHHLYLSLQWQNGLPQIIWPPEYATASAIPLFAPVS